MEKTTEVPIMAGDAVYSLQEFLRELDKKLDRLADRMTVLESRSMLSEEVMRRFSAVEQLAGTMDTRLTVHLAQEHHPATKQELDDHDVRLTHLEQDVVAKKEVERLQRWIYGVFAMVLIDLIRITLDLMPHVTVGTH